MRVDRSFLKDNKGQGLVELALILPVLLLLFLGVTEFGRVLYLHLLMTSAAREGARAAAVGAGNVQVKERVSSVLKNYIVVEGEDFEAGQVSFYIIPVDEQQREVGSEIQVGLRSRIEFLTPLFTAIVGEKMDLSALAVMRVEKKP